MQKYYYSNDWSFHLTTQVNIYKAEVFDFNHEVPLQNIHIKWHITETRVTNDPRETRTANNTHHIYITNDT